MNKVRNMVDTLNSELGRSIQTELDVKKRTQRSMDIPESLIDLVTKLAPEAASGRRCQS
jgi:hypothetical protein